MLSLLSFMSTLVRCQTPARPAPRDTAVDSIAGWATRTVLPGRQLLGLPSDDPRAALTLVPGAALRGNALGIGSGSTLSLRLRTRGGAGVYIDGAPARLLITGGQGPSLAGDALEAVAVTTGLPDVSIDDGRGGVIEYVTRADGVRLAGHVVAQTDEHVRKRLERRVQPVRRIRRGPAWRAALVVGERRSDVHQTSIPADLPANRDSVSCARRLLRLG